MDKIHYKELIEKYKDQLVRLPMRKGLRSLNLSNAAAVMVYEALRQNDFESLNRCGHLTQYETES